MVQVTWWIDGLLELLLDPKLISQPLRIDYNLAYFNRLPSSHANAGIDANLCTYSIRLPSP